jgi:hypothetical protein
MRTYKTTLSGAYCGTASLRATALDVAVKRVLGGGFQAHFKYATVSPEHRA